MSFSIDGNVFREVFKKSYMNRSRYRTSRRNMEDIIRLGLFAKELVSLYFSVVKWNDFDRVLRINVGVTVE
ncbi:hypothetical protein QPL79_03835 [Ignisphaera sp. 4213-co]|mgnify:CR=1 FL=1|uniref:Uncharacterized protein n=1 Tax=Ignisphaera cupida TaxID=3050454 RepID=A0ABD4Z5A6_9CREN|nr:hypothetical protein [Ignisphaera sp. 4213-co]MDK6028486.1 hypothetical protein [Ignisphaera sp. 4213-co]